MTQRSAPLVPSAATADVERLPAFDATLDARGVVRLERRARNAGHLADIVKRLNQSLEVERVYTLVARHAMELLGASGARLAILEGDDARVVAAAGSLAGDIGRRGAPDEAREGACAHVGLAVGSQTIGDLLVADVDRVRFDDDDVQLLETLGAHAAIAIENARLYRASVRTTRHTSVLASAARSLALSITPSAMYADIARIARGSLGTDGVTIYLADADSGRVKVAHAEGVASDIAMRLAPALFWNGGAGHAVRAGEALFRSDIAAYEDEHVMRELAARGVRSVAALPIVVEGRPRGLLALRFRARQDFPSDQRQMLLDFTAHVAIAMRNARLVGDLERRVTQLTAIAQLQQAISAAASPEQVYRELYRAVAAVVDAPCFTLFRYDEEEERLVPELVVSDGQELDSAALPRVPLGDGPTSAAYRTHEPNVTGRDMPGWTGVAYERTNGRQIAVVLSAPIVHGDRALGVLQAQSYDSEAYDAAAVDLTMLIARQAGTAMVNAMALENERREREQAEAAATIARLALRATDIVDAADELLEVIMRSSRAHGVALGAAAEDGTVRCVATRGRIGVSLGEALTMDSAAPEISVPLSSAGRVLGVVRAAPARGGMLAERDVAALTRLADPLALALDTMLLRADERRQESRQRMLAVGLQTMDHPVFILSLDRRIRFANAAASRQYGYTNEELLGMSIHRLAVRPEAQREEDTLGEVLEGSSGVWTGERLHRRKDGSELPASVVVNAIRDTDGRPIGMVAVMRDLTDERRVAEQLRQSEKLAALGELVAGVAHEVNNPLTGISAMTQLLLEERLSDEQVESLRLIKREADRAVAVIRDLLTFARKTGPRVVPVEFNPLIEQTLRLRTYGLRTAGVEVVLQLDSELPSVLGDDRLLQQVLLNLIVNAEYAMQGGSHRVLTIRTFVRAQRVIVEVADTGCGMTPEVQKRIFEPFFTTKPDGRGTGLGLSVSYGILQTHGGTLTVHTAPGAGATFRISFPTAGHTAGAPSSDSRP
jgi:PAS domain S-box-containing protein